MLQAKILEHKSNDASSFQWILKLEHSVIAKL
jgi:hypothetical protein